MNKKIENLFYNLLHFEGELDEGLDVLHERITSLRLNKESAHWLLDIKFQLGKLRKKELEEIIKDITILAGKEK